MIAAGFSWFHLIPQVDDGSLVGFDPSHSYVYVVTGFVCTMILGFCVLGRIALERAKRRDGLERFMTGSSMSFLVFGELLTGFVKGFMGDMLDKDDVRRFFPLISAIFFYILCCNLCAIVPGMLPPTDYINTNVGMAVISYLAFNYVGLSRDWRGYIGHLMGPVIWMAPLLFVIELISLFVRPASLTIRLTGNMFGDHQVFVIMSGMLDYVFPVALMLLACMVSTIQAFIFSLLTTIYIGLSVPHHDHAH
jgi:F-type H+-transporting ATPase subunit a